MADHVNFYENLKEAHLRLRQTVVLYDGLPYTVVAITDHKGDGVFRTYLQPCGDPNFPSIYPLGDYNAENPALGPALDGWMAENPKVGLLRKKMNSPLFNKFRPFPLGMYDAPQKTYYLERQPERRTSQGLIGSMIYASVVSAGQRSDLRESPGRGGVVSFNIPGFVACVTGMHTNPKDCLEGMLDTNNYQREAAAFDRHFAFVRGPLDLMFLGYKDLIIGSLPKSDLSEVRIGKKFRHTIEVVEKLGVFSVIN